MGKARGCLGREPPDQAGDEGCSWLSAAVPRPRPGLVHCPGMRWEAWWFKLARMAQQEALLGLLPVCPGHMLRLGPKGEEGSTTPRVWPRGHRYSLLSETLTEGFRTVRQALC